MPKRLASEDQAADPVRSRLQSTARSVADLVGRASAPATSTLEPQARPKVVAAPEPRAPVAASGPSPAPIKQRRDPTPRRPAEGQPEAASIVRKARYTASEAEANAEILRLISRLTGSKPSDSGVTRVLWSLLRDAEAGLKRQGRNVPVLRRPPNGPSIEMAAYERDLGRFILSALKSLEL